MAHTKQMDIYLRMWNAIGVVRSRYYGSVFMGHAGANGMLEKLTHGKQSLSLAKLVQISIDGPA